MHQVKHVQKLIWATMMLGLLILRSHNIIVTRHLIDPMRFFARFWVDIDISDLSKQWFASIA